MLGIKLLSRECGPLHHAPFSQSHGLLSQPGLPPFLKPSESKLPFLLRLPFTPSTVEMFANPPCSLSVSP